MTMFKNDIARAMRAVAQWHFGDEHWGEIFYAIAITPDPVAHVEAEYLDGETVAGLLEDRHESR